MTLTIAARQDMSSPPRVRLDVDSTVGAPLPTQNGASVSVLRVHQDGSQWPVLLESGARIGAGSWAGFDYHAPFNSPVRYVVKASGNTSAQSTQVFIQNNRTWLIHPSDPSLSLHPDFLTKIGSLSFKSNAETFEVYNSEFPVTVSTGFRRAASTSIEFMVTPDRVDSVLSLLSNSGAILLNTPATAGWDVKWSWIQPGDVTVSNAGGEKFRRGAVNYPYRAISFPFVRIGAPDVDVTPLWTCDDVVETYATINAMLAHYTTCENLALDVRS